MSLMNMPLDVLNEIASHMDRPSIFKLSLTCKDFHAFLTRKLIYKAAREHAVSEAIKPDSQFLVWAVMKNTERSKKLARQYLAAGGPIVPIMDLTWDKVSQHKMASKMGMFTDSAAYGPWYNDTSGGLAVIRDKVANHKIFRDDLYKIYYLTVFHAIEMSGMTAAGRLEWTKLLFDNASDELVDRTVHVPHPNASTVTGASQQPVRYGKNTPKARAAKQRRLTSAIVCIAFRRSYHLGFDPQVTPELLKVLFYNGVDAWFHQSTAQRTYLYLRLCRAVNAAVTQFTDAEKARYFARLRSFRDQGWEALFDRAENAPVTDVLTGGSRSKHDSMARVAAFLIVAWARPYDETILDFEGGIVNARTLMIGAEMLLWVKP
ncbi:hypothetical protein B0T22DRAFT_512434 [Podospora appendiculata]|uniref:F-box domain-containing protein n=1 Tax=Podospora appendiculata TaxID=314037 RepID=A0AAE1CCJ9_9PEZI|nr:hypothetical protein B0T22DRAFT_512434 [Podospora appendiculata]